MGNLVLVRHGQTVWHAENRYAGRSDVALTPRGVEQAAQLAVWAQTAGLAAVWSSTLSRARITAQACSEAAGLPLVVAGPAKDEALARELERRGARVTGYVDQEELVLLYRGAACLVQPSRYEGFGLPVLEAMASGTPVVAVPEPALREVAGEAAVWAEERELGDGIRRAIAERERLVTAGLERARLFSWRETARRTLEVYREALGR